MNLVLRFYHFHRGQHNFMKTMELMPANTLRIILENFVIRHLVIFVVSVVR